MENMAEEIMTAVTNFYEDDDELVSTCLRYLMSTTTDMSLANKAMEFCDAIGYCPYCGTEYEFRLFKDTNGDIIEIEYCPYCSESEGY